MQLFVALCVLSFAVAGLEAAPQRLDWVELVEARKTYQPKDIWSNCGKSGDEATIDSVTITPDPPVKGQDVNVKATVTFKEQVTGGNVKVSIKYGIIPVYSTTLDLCELLSQTTLKCPVAAGTDTVNATQSIPTIIPSGHYTGNVEVTDQNGNELGCVDLDIHF